MDLLPTSSQSCLSKPPTPPPPARPQRGNFATVKTGIRNIFKCPCSLKQKMDTGPTYINNRDFFSFLRDEKNLAKCPRTFDGVIFDDSINESRDITRPFKFKDDTFINPVFNMWDPPHGSEMRNCTFSATHQSLDWFGLAMAKICWKGSTFDGLYTLAGPVTAPSTILSELSSSKMKNCIFKNLIFTPGWTTEVKNADFSGSTFKNVIFVAQPDSNRNLYLFNRVNFSNINAEELLFEQVSFTKNVSFRNAKINNLTLMKAVDFSGADFSGYKKGNITLSDDMFSSDVLIDFNLNSINNAETGANFFNTLASLNNLDVRIDWIEQLIEKFSTLLPLNDSMRHPSLMLSVLKELRHGCYSKSQVIKDFLPTAILSVYKNEILPAVILYNRSRSQDIVNMLIDILTRSTNLATAEIMGFQFIAHQLMTVYPGMAGFWYQLSPLDKLMTHLCDNILMSSADEPSRHHLFYHPVTGRALYLTRRSFEGLIRSRQPPTEYSIFTCDERGEITDRPVNQQETAKTLQSFPALLHAWSAGGDHLVVAVKRLLSTHDVHQPDDVIRVEQIATHWINLLGRKASNKLNLTSTKDVDLLQAALAPFYEHKDAKLARRETVEEIRSYPTLCHNFEGLSESQINAVMSFTLAKVLTALSSSAYCGMEMDSPRPLRLLAAFFIIDCHDYWPGLVRDTDIMKWLEILDAKDPETFTCSAYLAALMVGYRLQIPEAERISRLLKSLYPF